MALVGVSRAWLHGSFGRVKIMAKRAKPRSRSKAPAQPRLTAEDKQFRTEDDLRTLRRAEEIKKDKSRVADARKLAKLEVAALRKI